MLAGSNKIDKKFCHPIDHKVRIRTAMSVFRLIFFWAGGHAIFQGGRTKYSTLIYRSTLADCRFRQCQVR